MFHQHKSQFLESSNRVDQLYHGLLAGSDDCGQMWSVVKMLLLLSHGQATVERGFSVNRQVDGDNLHAGTFCIRRLICDTVAYFGGVYAIDTTNKALLLSCSSAWHKYQLDLERKKKNCMKDTMTRKTHDEIQNLKRRKLQLSTDIESLAASADQLAQKAESSRAISILVKSNAIRQASKEMVIEMTELDKKLADKLLERKN